MKFGITRLLFVLALSFTVLYPEMLVSVAQAQTKSFGEQMIDSLGIFLYPFIILVVGGFTLIIFNGIAIREGIYQGRCGCTNHAGSAESKYQGALSLCDQYKLPVTSVLKGGLSRIQDDELDIEQIEKGLKSLRYCTFKTIHLD